MFDVFTRAGVLEITLSVVAICGILGALAQRKGSQEARSLRKENRRLRNIVANLMIDNAQIRDTR